MIKILKQKISSLIRILSFFDKWFKVFSYSFFFYIILIFIATIFEGISILSLIPLIQSIQTETIDNNPELSLFNKYLFDIKENFGFGTTELIVFFFSLQTIKLLLTHLADLLLFKKTIEINQRMQYKIIESLSNMSWIDSLKISTGKINNLVSQDASKSASCFKILCNGINYSIFIVIYLFGLLFISIKATIIVAIFSVITFTILKIFSKYTYRQGSKITKSSKNYLDLITDLLLQMKPLKALNNSNYVKDKINSAFFNYRDSQILQKYLGIGLSFFQNLTLIILFGFIIIFFLQKGNIYIVDSFIFIFVSYRLSQQMMIFQVNINILIAYVPSINQIQNFFLISNKKKEQSYYGFLKLKFKEICFKNVECKIGNKVIFKNLNLIISKGSFYAIIGKSGIGKTSLIDMITGLIFPSVGSILINEIDFKKIDIKHWRSKISYVPREHFLLKDSIKNNIILNHHFDKKKFNKILNNLELNDLDSESMVDEKGENLSVGQKQRISIARALYSDNEILILDEPTSNLNSLLEKKILTYIKKQQKTVIMITHNLTATKYAKIVYKVGKNGLTKI